MNKPSYRQGKDAAGRAALRKEQREFVTTVRQGQMLRVPPGTTPEICPACSRPIYRLVVNNKAVEVDCDVPDGVVPNQYRAGYGVSHVSQCAARQVGRRFREEIKR